MTNYLFYIEGPELEMWVAAETYKEARRKCWASLEYHIQDNVVQIECIDEEPVV